MSRLIISILLIFCTAFPHVQGQSAVGSKAAVNLSKFFVTESTQRKSTIKAGGSFGCFYRHQLREAFSVEVDMMFHYLTSGMEDLTTGRTADYHYFGMEFPAYGLMHANFDRSTLYFGFGPFASVGFISRFEANNQTVDPYKKSRITDEAVLRRWDFGIGFLAGYELGFGLQINVNYHLGMRDMLEAGSGSGTMTSQMVGVGVGYRF